MPPIEQMAAGEGKDSLIRARAAAGHLIAAAGTRARPDRSLRDLLDASSRHDTQEQGRQPWPSCSHTRHRMIQTGIHLDVACWQLFGTLSRAAGVAFYDATPSSSLRGCQAAAT